MFDISQKVWCASVKSKQKWLTCPDCFGKKFLTVTLGDDSQVTIECAGCRLGYDPPRGVVSIYEYEPEVCQMEITGMEIDSEKIQYRFGYYSYDAEDVFGAQAFAEARAEQLMNKHNQEQHDQFQRKAKAMRTWAWHVHYHRDCIKRAQRDLEYHTVKLEAAKQHVKADNGLARPVEPRR